MAVVVFCLFSVVPQASHAGVMDQLRGDFGLFTVSSDIEDVSCNMEKTATVITDFGTETTNECEQRGITKSDQFTMKIRYTARDRTCLSSVLTGSCNYTDTVTEGVGSCSWVRDVNICVEREGSKACAYGYQTGLKKRISENWYESPHDGYGVIQSGSGKDKAHCFTLPATHNVIPLPSRVI